jgi:hypothetical protein
MESFREQRCRACKAVFYVCRRCDRGQAYCGEVCRRAGRCAVVRAAKQRYRQHALVREDERERLRDRRARVRDQGSKEVAPEASVPAAALSTSMDDVERGGGEPDASNDGLVDGLRPAAGGEVPCARCGRCARFVRTGWLRAGPRARVKIRARAP